MMDLKIAVVCMSAVLGDIQGNMDRIAEMASAAAQGGAQMVCFPEFSATGYALENPGRYCSAGDTDRILDCLIRLGRDMGIVLMVGIIEHGGREKPFVSQVVAGPEGLVGIYRKTHLSPTEKGVYAPGEDLGVFTCRSWIFGIQLCYEAHFPEISTTMALKGADILFFPHASPRGDRKKR